ncbi:hypothetical protein OM076_03600 [Solirubrobacter ginsenosidimutans]|uniref:PH domain-containing protein n=1 Tax=Solirubrobacter ginsenosidimutans TaxID=490573 RepID=A0A9X3MNF2_9ACTN|nr:hypothetical protein [Solirubrobacter ginsenosidimutans]MDA0159340.1 hypothetical protein [Solirubrobacter ginsenosidimutans]
MTPARPGPDARLVGRGRVRALVGFACLGALSVAGFTDHSADGYLAGIVLVLGAVFGWTVVLWARVWVDGDVLYARKLGGWDVPLRLDRLTHAELGSSSGHLLHLIADGHRLKLDPWSLRLKPLYAVLACYIGPEDPIANRKLQRRLAKARRGRRPSAPPSPRV